MKLRVVSAYKNDAQGLAYEAGEEIDVGIALADFLLRDAPENFERVQQESAVPLRVSPTALEVVKRVAQDQRDKMQRSARVSPVGDHQGRKDVK